LSRGRGAVNFALMAEKSNSAPERPRDFLTGQMLIAMPNMGDPRFEQSLIFMCSHDDEHAMGIIVNKPLADIGFADLLEQLDIEAGETAADAPVFFGGPVQTERGVVLHTLDYALETTVRLSSDLGMTASKEVLIDIGGRAPANPPPRRYLLAIGHAGWGAGQLEQEIAMNAWAHCDADEAIIFDGATEATWKRALSSLGVTGAMLSPEWASARDEDQPLN